MSNAVTRITLASESDDPLETVRRALAFADDMVKLGAQVSVTGDLSMTVRFDDDRPKRQDNPTTADEVTEDLVARLAGA